MDTRNTVLVCRHQALVEATPRSVWELVGHPNRHPEWWPEVVEVQGKRFGRGCEYCHVAREGDGVTETIFLVEKVAELKELLVRCEESGLYMRWRLTEAQEGTFVDSEFGLDTRKAAESDPDFDPVRSKDRLRHWLETSLDGLTAAAVAQDREPPNLGLDSHGSHDSGRRRA